MKKLKTFLKALLAVTILLACMYFFIYRGDNRITIWLHHGLWLPNSTTSIHFRHHPGFMAHLVGLDDWATTEFDIPKTELPNMLRGQQYEYTTSVDSAGRKLNSTYWSINYAIVPDSIMIGPLPISLKLRSSRGDFLKFTAEERTKDMAHVRLYTDWN